LIPLRRGRHSLQTLIDREHGAALRTFHLRVFGRIAGAAEGKGGQKRQCQNQANQFLHSPSPPFFFQINCRIPKGNFKTIPPSARWCDRGGKEDSVNLTNNDFLVKKKIQQKNQRENPIFWSPEAVKNHF